MYVLPVGTVAAKFRIPKLADKTYFGLYMSMLLDVDLVVHLMGGG